MDQRLKDFDARVRKEREELEKRIAKEAVLPTPRIEVISYYGKNGAFALNDQLLYKCEIVWPNGSREFGGSWMSEGYGNPNPKFARSDARLRERLLELHTHKEKDHG